MKTQLLALSAFVFIFLSIASFGQSSHFKMAGSGAVNVDVNKTFSTSTEIFPFGNKNVNVYGMSVTGKITLNSEDGLVRIILVDKNFREHLVFETYSLLASSGIVSLDELCEETSVLDGIRLHSVKLEIANSEVELNSFTLATRPDPVVNLARLKQEKKQAQNQEKIKKINENLKKKGMHWVAGPTSVSELSYEEKIALFGESTFPAGFEYYSGGVISAGGPTLKSAAASQMAPEWDWRSRHGQNWVTPVVNQSSCGSYWAFSAVGAVEALVNLWFNQQLHLDLSEQDVLSCSGAGSCSGGNPGRALDYIASTGVVDEGAFPCLNSNGLCTDKSASPSERIKTGGRIDFGSELYPQTEDGLKRMIIENGPLSGGLFDWNHTMVLAGYKVVEEGDTFFYRDLNLSGYWKTVESGDPLIGKTVWIFKNSYGKYFGDAGYIYVETAISNMGWTHAVQTPLVSEVNDYGVICEDRDGDGYYWWGLGEKPETCDCPDIPDGDDSNPALGPLDEFGNCIPLSVASPVADFTAEQTVLTEGETVQFTDLSANEPVSWQWSFEGGTPSASAEKNPAVEYATAGIYTVSLTVTNGGGEDTRVYENYISVEAPPVNDTGETDTTDNHSETYCFPADMNSAFDFIRQVSIAGVMENITGADGYSLDETPVSIMAGERYNVVLVPGNTEIRNFWKMWIDLNGDGVFDEKNEKLVSLKNRRGIARTTLAVPASAGGEAVMRISVKAGGEPFACDDGFSGEVEDYTLWIEPAAPKHKSAVIENPEPAFSPGVKIYPNPVAGHLTIQLEKVFPGDAWALYSLTGEILRAGQIEQSRTGAGLFGFAPGVYFIVVKNGTSSFREKIIKK